MSNPVLVTASRGDIVENRHRGAVAVCDPNGKLIFRIGDIDTPVYPRSAIKALQALPLVESGAADHFQLSEPELAIACSSHGAEQLHTDTVLGLLARIDLDQNALECGAHAPLHEPSATTLLQQQGVPGRIHNNCSGKHAGMLATASFYSEPTRGYIDREHPSQQRWFDAVGAMSDTDMRQLPWNFDGCGIPVIAMPLVAIATAFARLAVPDDLPAERADAINRITSAIAAHPFMVAGSGRLCTEIMQLTGKRLLVKTGAAGVYTAALPEKGLGIALKIDDGSGEAAQVALLAILTHLNALHRDEIDALSHRIRLPVANTRRITTGYYEAAKIS